MTGTGAVDGAAIPILLYHAVTETPSEWIAPFSATPAAFANHLDLVVASGRVPLTVSQFVDARGVAGGLPPNPVVITFDDGFADTAHTAVPLLQDRGLTGTVYVTTGFVGGDSPDPMISRSQLADLAAAGIEIGAHSHSHPQLDTLPLADAEAEIVSSRRWLEDVLGQPVRTFAYPHGYSSPAIRRMVARLGFGSCCAVRNALSSATDDRFSLARLMVRSTTTPDQVAAWLAGRGAPVAPFRESPRTTGWRAYRRTRAALRSSGSRRGGRSQVS